MAASSPRPRSQNGNGKHFAAAEDVYANRDPNNPGASLHDPPQPTAEVGGAWVDVAKAGIVRRTVQKGLHLVVEALADAAHI